ncbi:MAG TPA: hypothetical protein DCS82_07780 [Rhodospirillaceae bacterium]|nr:hypothetical protein [Rhodospirillaceae bacterium]HAA91519.1 hypothetical protein [Rhodospirillaceae bacterium]HAT35599.1 hypothetical protein [Rhodospirillaceae bacterium]|tara:strand:- start:1064 stop:1552 length:489 start_codon:yes stop_codon:yes gene_type:complete
MLQETAEPNYPDSGHNVQHPLKIKGLETKQALEALLVDEIQRLTAGADVCIFALYDAECPNEGPIDFSTHERDRNSGSLEIEVDFDFEGIGVWYICNRYGDAYKLRHILVQVHQGRFVKGQVEEFEGYWEEFPQFVADDRWVKAIQPMPPQLPKIVETALEA